MNKMQMLLPILAVLIVFDVKAVELPSGDEIAERINARDEGIAVFRHLKMEMIDKNGKKRERNTQGYRKKYENEKRTVIFYKSPKNVKGTGFLIYDYADKALDDDQWLYLPAMRKVKRISSSDRGDYFLGTDFTYEDIKLETRVSIADYNRKTIGEDEVDGHHCIVVEVLPASEEIAEELGYGRGEMCVDDSIWIVRRYKLWDVYGNPLKTITSREIKQVQDIWTVHNMVVDNHKSGHRTVFTFSNIDYQTDVKDSMFTKKALQRGL